jgi:glycosyltransferase involved in cell wall biosynthesis
MTGTDRYYFDLVRTLSELGISVQGLVIGEPEKLNDPLPYVRAFSSYGVSRLSRWKSVRREVRRSIPQCNVVVSHGVLVTFPTLDIIRDRPLVVHFHGPSALEIRAEKRRSAIISCVRHFQETLLYRQADRFIVLSRAFSSVLCNEYGVDPTRVCVIPGGVSLERFQRLPSRRKAREQLNLPLDRPLVGTVRRLVSSKGIDRLIDAIDIVRQRIPDVFCAVAGGGPLAAILQRKIDERALGNHIRLLGFISDEQLPLIYRASNIFVVPTVALEGFGLVVLESLASGTPALVTPVGGLAETVDQLDPRLIMRSSSSVDIADGLFTALSGSVTLPPPEACVEYARRFDWRVIATRIARVYSDALEAGT